MAAVEVVFLTVFWSWVIVALIVLRQTITSRRVSILRNTPDLPLQSVDFDASDGAPLAGWKLAGHPGRPWILMAHGSHATSEDLLPLAGRLHQAGFNAFVFDFRGHGRSPGRIMSFGLREQRDLEGALAFLGSQPDVPAAPYGFYGASMGGAVGVMVAARDERLLAVAVDGIYVNLEAIFAQYLRRWFRLPRWPFGWFASSAYRLRFGKWPRKISPLAAAAANKHSRFLFIGGQRDDRTPGVWSSELQRAATRERAETWVLPMAGHLDGLTTQRADYPARLVGFFESALTGA